MKKYLCSMEVLNAEGYQTYAVRADSQEDAIKLFKQGEGIFQEEEVQVTSCEWDLSTIQEMPDND